MKSYTDIEQSRKLAEFLPIESADMCYKCIGEDPYDVCLRPYSEWREEYKGLLVAKEVDVIPCWSLAALLGVIPQADLHSFNEQWTCYSTPNRTYSKTANNPVDACVVMIEKLNELNLL